MLNALLLLRELLRKHGHRKDAAWLDRQLAASHGDLKALATLLNSNLLWGGSGSIADQFLVPREQESQEIQLDRKAFYECMASLAHAMREQGVCNQRAAAWANAFSQWSNQSAGGFNG